MLSDGSLGTVPEGWNKSLQILMTKTRELSKMVDDLLEAARTDAKPLPDRPIQLDLREVVQAAVDRARPRADLLHAEIASGLCSTPIPVEGDAKQLGRLLDNLVNNGLTYTVRPPRLSITVSAQGDRAFVRVADNGVGIAGDERERVFDRFHRTMDPAFHDVPGTGLGLYISRQIAEGHAGRLLIESSEPGAGTVFALALPLATR